MRKTRRTKSKICFSSFNKYREPIRMSRGSVLVRSSPPIKEQGTLGWFNAGIFKRDRVEHVCIRLGLVSIAPLWMQDQDHLLNDMVSMNVSLL